MRACTLGELEERFAAVLPATLFPRAAAKANSRRRVYTPWRTFFCLLWQCLQPGASGREVVRQLQAVLLLADGRRISGNDAAYFRARARLPQGGLERALTRSAQAVERARREETGWLQGRSLKAVDGSAVTLPDTAANRAAYPAVHTGGGPCFPLLRLVVLFSLAGGAVLAAAYGNLRQAELTLFASLAAHLAKGDIVVGDRGFGCYSMLAWLPTLGVDFVGRTTRRLDARHRTARLGPGDWLMQWSKPTVAAPWLPGERWDTLPATMTVRVVRGQVARRGFRVRHVAVVTTLLDPVAYPAEQILEAYRRRWRLELCLDDLKTTLQLEMLRGRSPLAVRQEVLARLIAHNLVRWTMGETARTHHVALERLSFKGTLDTLRHFSVAMGRARSHRQRRKLWAELLRTLAADLVPLRPGRREPRAVKRKRNKYPHLSQPRTKFRDRPKRNQRRARSRRRALALK